MKCYDIKTILKMEKNYVIFRNDLKKASILVITDVGYTGKEFVFNN